MYATQQYEERVMADLKSQVVGFDFTILVPIVIQVLAEVLGSCGKEKAEVLRHMQNATNDFWAKTITLQAVRKTLNNSGQTMSLRDQIVTRDALLSAVGDGRSALLIYEDVTANAFVMV